MWVMLIRQQPLGGTSQPPRCAGPDPTETRGWVKTGIWDRVARLGQASCFIMV